MKEITAKEFVRKRDRPDADDVRSRQRIRVLLPEIGVRYGLAGDALEFAMDNAMAHPRHALWCLQSIERSLVPR